MGNTPHHSVMFPCDVSLIVQIKLLLYFAYCTLLYTCMPTEINSLKRDRTFNLLPFYHQKHYICTFSENCSPTLNVFKVLLTYNLTETEHKLW